MASEIKVDTISEKTSANGVTIDSLSIKDGGLVAAGNIDVNGNNLVLDANANTYLDAGTDDTIKFYVSGAHDLTISANAINVLSGTTLTIDSGATIANSGTATGFSSADPASADGDTLGTASLEWSDLYLADSSVIYFGADQDTTLTHTDGTGLTLNSTNKLCFNDATQFIQGSSGTVLSIGATDEIDLTATAVDLNGTLNVSGVATFQATPVFPDGSLALADLDIDGGTDIGAALVDADEIIVDDGGGGTNRRCDMSRVKTYIGDHTPTFLAYQNGAVTINSASATLINLQTEAHDSDGKFASSRFTPTVAGTYFVSGAVAFFDTDMDVATAFIYFNGAEKVKSAFGSSGGIKPVEISRHVSGTFVMDTDDYVELYGYAESSNDGTIAIGHNSTSYQSYLTAFRLA